MAKIIKLTQGYGVQIPMEICKKLNLKENDEVEFFEIKDGVYVFLKREKIPQILMEVIDKEKVEEIEKKETEKKEIKGMVSEGELAVLRKLDMFRFEERIPRIVNKFLSDEEKMILTEMVKKRFVTVYKGKKYKEAVYNISDNVYPLLLRHRIKDEKKPNNEEILHKKGYMILDNEAEAKNISVLLENRIKKGEILGIRSFDKKFYITTKEFYELYRKEISDLLKTGGREIYEIAKKLGIDEDACKVILLLMGNEGEVVEKKKGYYALA